MPAVPLTTEFATLEACLEAKRRRVEEALQAVAPAGGRVGEAVAHSLFAPAKRLRPVLALLTAECLLAPGLRGLAPGLRGRREEQPVLPAACAIEMVHTASLILDDLPSMDDARERRGRPTCHVAYGEAMAILAAFALINRAFELLACGWSDGPDADARAGFGVGLARAIGLEGMIAGQALDLATTERNLDFATLELIHSRKTGALFIAAAELGALAAGARPPERAAIAAYAKNLGLAFQIVDDLIDVTGQPGEVGKDTGKDLRKTTFVSFAGVEGARQLASELAAASQEALKGFGPRAEPLKELARYVVARRR